MKLSFIGVGSPKCASSTIVKCLSTSNSVGVPHLQKNNPNSPILKETAYFITGHYSTTPAEYENLFDDFSPIRGEWTPFYIQYDEALQLIREYNPYIKILYAVRNPIQRIFSQYNYLITTRVARGNYNKPDLLSELKKGDHFSTAIPVKNPIERLSPATFIYNSKYGDHYKRLTSIFSEDQLHIIKYEDLVNSMQSTINSTLGFLGAEPIECPTSVRAGRKSNSYIAEKEKELATPIIQELLYKDMQDFYTYTDIDYRF